VTQDDFASRLMRVDFGDFILKSTIALMGFAERDQLWLHVLDTIAVVISVARFWLSARSG
jgi:hypothetical protein